MAKNAKYYAKISNNWEQQYFETTAGQTTFDSSSVTGLIGSDTTVQAALESLNNAVGADSGIASLGSDGKLVSTQVPSYLIGGMNFEGTIDLSTAKDGDDLADAGLSNVGDYLIVTTAGNINNDVGSTSLVQISIQSPGDDGGDTSLPLALEAGDWIVLTGTGTNSYTLSIINNTYKDATSSAKGIVTLSNYADGDGWSALTSGTKVVTEAILGNALADNFGTAAGTVAEGNHSHSQYLLKAGGEVAGDLTVGDGSSSNDHNLIINAENTSAGTSGSRSGDIRFKYVEAISGTTTLVNLDVTSGGSLEFAGYTVAHENNWNSTAVGIPEITVSTTTPNTQGKDGDVWIEYTA